MLPEETYIQISGAEQVLNESKNSPNLSIERIQHEDKVVIFQNGKILWLKTNQFPPNTDEGIVSHVKGTNYPFRSSIDPHGMFAMNSVKSIFIEVIKNISPVYFIPILLTVISQKRRNNLISSFNRIGYKILSPYILKDEYLSKFGKEIKKLIFNFLNRLGVDKEQSEITASIFTHILENDNAYNLRLKDIFTETNIRNLIDKPFNELNRLNKIIAERDDPPVVKKMTKFIILIKLSLLIPQIKQAYYSALSKTNIDNLKSDDNDRYWSAFRTDYKFMGKTKDERMELAKQKGWSYPF